MTKTNVSRRAFFKGAAFTAAGAGIAGLGLSGCASPKGSSEAPAKASATSNVSPQEAISQLNPQDWDYRSNSVKDWNQTSLFTSWKFGNLTLNNRMVKSAAGSAYLPWWTTEMTIAEYTHWAKGGVELMFVEDYASLLPHYPAAYKMRTRENAELDKVAAAIHEAGAYCGYQLSLMGASFSGFDATTAPQFACAEADDLTLEEVHTVQSDFIDAAKFLKEQGFDAVEINAAGNNIGQAFLSRNRNKRTDEYGPQSFENRARFVVEMIEGIKRECGADFPVQVLINVIEENDYDLGNNSTLTTLEENIEMCKLFEKAGANSLHLRLGPFNNHPAEFASDMYFTGYGIDGVTGYGNMFDFSRHFQGKLIANHSGCGMLLDVAAEMRKAVSIPVGCVTFMDPAHAPDMFVGALDEGKADFYMMNRPFMVDPEYINKLKENRADEIRPCNRCLHCHFDLDEDGVFYEHCRMNACHMRAFTEQMPEGPDIPAGSGSKNVMVVGGGPAGMEAARVAALRGYTVTLYEKKSDIGGLLDFAEAVKGQHENIGRDKEYFKRQMEVCGVKVVTGQEVDAAFVKQQNPDAVIVATGGLRDTLGLSAGGKTNIVSIEDFLTSDIGQNVCVVGTGAQAVDATLRLLSQGKEVIFVSPDPIEKLDRGQSDHIKGFVIPMLYTRGVRVWPNAQVKSVGDGSVTISCDTGVDMTFECDTVIEAMDMLPDTSLADALSGMNVQAVGDCKKPFNIAEAIAAGNLAARAI
ncbi:tat (twin-arginine translocation) pathway signal sequence [Denitrobacterium detoxificans]|uniref:2,4-dienoyl-CoA reductase n=1 Tax=Denitrobacterium detoxificans TaxID=79604 RepID=A0A172RYH0_9ACTN|nr:FAD-dependent oxidoreductase [Denitrobacterium detoxificans]ANE22756.1 tat (twin-arginine translocation) pathway signal sequence [Denitrobacterium detoxificans]SEO77647.1 2,4-dienoyl-CoA reductase [Denitrobacterium detoxificans]